MFDDQTAYIFECLCSKYFLLSQFVVVFFIIAFILSENKNSAAKTFREKDYIPVDFNAHIISVSC